MRIASARSPTLLAPLVAHTCRTKLYVIMLGTTLGAMGRVPGWLLEEDGVVKGGR